MNWDKTPAEVALEMQLAETNRKLAYYEAKDRYERDILGNDPLKYGTLDLGTRIMPSPVPNLVIPRTASISAAEEAGMDIVVRAQTHQKDGKSIGQQYFISRQEAMSTRDQAQLLGFLHERFITNLGAFIKENQ